MWSGPTCKTRRPYSHVSRPPGRLARERNRRWGGCARDRPHRLGAAREADQTADGWRAYLAATEEEDNGLEVDVFCPQCASREFGAEAPS
jgi:hypothetical protein